MVPDVRLLRWIAGRARSIGRRAWRARSRLMLGALAALGTPLVALFVLAALTPLPPELLEPPSPSVRVLARDGRLLREVRAEDGARARPLPLSEFPKHVRDAVLAAE